MSAGRWSHLATAALLFACMIGVTASRANDAAKQRDEQRKVQARVEEASRRTSSTIDAMLYQRLSPSAEQKMLEDVAESLKGLSQTEIQAIIAHLEAAVTAPDQTRASAEQVRAYEKHRQVVAQLRGMLVRLELIRNLNEAAARLDRAATDQLAVNSETLTTLAARRPGRTARQLTTDRDEIGDKQHQLGVEVVEVFRQVEKLLPGLSAEEKERAEKADVKTRGAKLGNELTFTTRTLRQGAADDAAERQRRHAKELKDLAAALRALPADKLAQLRATRDKVDTALKAQEKLNQDTAKKADPEDRKANTPEAKQDKANALAAEQARTELATRDARKLAEQVVPEVAEDIRKNAENNQWKAEDKLRANDEAGAKQPQEKAADALRAAREELDRQIAAAELAKRDPLAAVKNASEQIEKLIQEQKDAREATKDAEKNDAKLPEAAAAQKDVAKKADALKNTPLPPNMEAKAALDKAAMAAKDAKADLDDKNPKAAQPDQTEAVKNLQAAKDALDKQAAAIEMRRDDIAKLEDAKAELQKLAAAEKQLANDAQKAADKADPMAGMPDPKAGDPKAGDPKAGDPKAGDPKMPDPKAGDPKAGDPKAGDPKAGDPKAGDPKGGDPKMMPDTGNLAKEQAMLQPPTKDVGDKLKETAPEAAKKVDQAGMKQEGAKADLAKNDPKAGAQKADAAAKDLADAAKAVDMALAEKRGMEANDQAALMPNNVDPMAAAQQLAKALEQANKAAEKANEAAMALNQPMPPMAGMQPKTPGDKGDTPPQDGTPMPKDGMPQPNLADLQKQVAKQAADAKQPAAAKAADAAAKAIEKGDLMAALDNQKMALDALKMAADAAPKDGAPMEGQPKDGMGKDGMPKDGMGKDGMPKDGMGKDGMPMGGMPGMGMGMPMPGEIAKSQEKLIDATKALQQSQMANQAAQAALAQAQAQAPMAVQGQLGMAGEQLGMAGMQLGMGQPMQAGMNQMAAADALQAALDALNAAAMANGMMGTQPGQSPMAMAGMQPGMMPGMGMQPGMGMGMQPGIGMQPGMGMAQQPGMGMQPGKGDPMNAGVSEGDKDGPEKLKNAASSGTAQAGDGSFIHLRKRERDSVQQAGEAQFPAEFRELIRQYNINVKNNRPTAPAPTPVGRP